MAVVQWFYLGRLQSAWEEEACSECSTRTAVAVAVDAVALVEAAAVVAVIVVVVVAAAAAVVVVVDPLEVFVLPGSKESCRCTMPILKADLNYDSSLSTS